MAFEAVDPALDRVTLAVVDWVEMRWPATAEASLLTVARLVGLVRDGAADPPGLPQALADVLIDWLEGDADAQDFAAWLGDPVDVIDEQMRDPDAKCLNS